MRSFMKLSAVLVGLLLVSTIAMACGSPNRPEVVEVEKIVEVAGETTTEIVEVEKIVTETVIEGVLVETEKILLATPTPDSGASPNYGLPDVKDDGRRYARGTRSNYSVPYDATFFQNYGVNPFVDPYRDALSTFAVDVDTASYTVARRFITDGYLPDPASVRVEEFVNYFDLGYAAPATNAFAIHIDGAPSPFGPSGDRGHWLLRVGLQGAEVLRNERKDASLVFVIDVSGSMGCEDRLGLVKESLRLLVDELRPSDRVGIVTYGSRARVVMEPTSLRHRSDILRQIDSLTPGGSTNAEAGLMLGYEMALDEVDGDRTTRVILLSDGVANVGLTSPDGILRQIGSAVDEGIDLTTIGVGMGNYNDVLMEQLADRGNGTYHYVDRLYDARRIFSESLSGTLQVIARDAKVQVEFNPAVVAAYRLIGYENRDVAGRDFRNNYVDAGEVGAGHSVTALYEIELWDKEPGAIGTVSVRYQDPDTNRVVELAREFFRREMAGRFEDADPRFQLAATVAEYAELLRHNYWARGGDLKQVADMAVLVEDRFPYDADVSEFVDLASRAYAIESGDRRYR
jgi:Ca-activated chloride channel family protein